MTKKLYGLVFGSSEKSSQEGLDELARAVGALPENIFSVIFMRYAQNKSLEEIAEVMNCHVTLVETWSKSGIAMLQCFLGVYNPDGRS